MSPHDLKAIRIDKLGLTQAQLAEKLGLTQSSIAQMERDIRPIEKITALAIEHLSCRRRKKKPIKL